MIYWFSACMNKMYWRNSQYSAERWLITPRVKGYSVTQLGSTANVVGMRTGSTAGHNLCHDLRSTGGSMRTFCSRIIGEGNSLTKGSSADPWTLPHEIRAVRSSMTHGTCVLIRPSKRMIYCNAHARGDLCIYSVASTPRYLREKLLHLS